CLYTRTVPFGSGMPIWFFFEFSIEMYTPTLGLSTFSKRENQSLCCGETTNVFFVFASSAERSSIWLVWLSAMVALLSSVYRWYSKKDSSWNCCTPLAADIGMAFFMTMSRYSGRTRFTFPATSFNDASLYVAPLVLLIVTQPERSSFASSAE